MLEMITIKDPLYGYILFEDKLSKIIDSPVFQRLRRIKQVFGSDFVYPSANHTRFEHSLGVGFLAGKMADRIKFVLEKEGEEFTDDDRMSLIVAGLLHDVGHGPFSHAFEGFLSKLKVNHENFTRMIILEAMSRDVEKLGLDAEYIAELAAGMQLKKAVKRPFMKQVIGSAVDADKLDYLRRDSYHAGTLYGFIDVDRIINNIRIFNNQLCIEEKAKQVLESMIIGRALAFEAIYYHKTSRAAQILIDRAINAAAEDLNLYEIKDDIEKYLELDDYIMWSLLMNNPKSREYMRMLASRNLLKVVWETKGVIDERTKTIISLLTNPRFRDSLENIIADEAGVDTKYVAIDLPTLPNIPYRHWIGPESAPMNIPILVKSGNTETIVSLSKISQFVKAIEGFFYAIRVYTIEKFRERVKEATIKTFQEHASFPTEEMYV